MICFVGPLPPPLHGMAAINADIVKELCDRTAVREINVNTGSLTRSPSYYARKIAAGVTAPFRIIAARLVGARVLYGSVDDALGGAWTSMFALTARSLGMTVYLHHHSYRYLVRPTAMMRVVTKAAGPRAHHITLSAGMERDLTRLYPAVRRTIVAPNYVHSATGEPGISHDATPHAVLTLGLLSNLTFAKGLREFVAVLETARAAGLPVRGLLAGPIPHPEERPFLEAALDRNAGFLEWRGPVSGEAKNRFFSDIDLFVFPTRFEAEAYPLVVLEALLRHVPVIATRRGCLDAFAGLKSTEIVPEADFVARALAAITRHIGDPVGLVALKHVAGQDGIAVNAENAAARTHLIDTLVAASR